MSHCDITGLSLDHNYVAIKAELESASKKEEDADGIERQAAIDLKELRIFFENLPIPLIDTHCHIDFILEQEKILAMKKDSPSHLESNSGSEDEENLDCDNRTFEDIKNDFRDEFPVNFGGFVAVFCDPENWVKYRIEDIFSPNEKAWIMFGAHPHHADELSYENALHLESLLDCYSAKVVALGEIGLDYSENNTVHPNRQKAAFLMQLKIALRRQLPICLHIREDDDDAFEILEQAKVPEDYPIHLHCFNDDWKKCVKWMQMYSNLKVGFTPIIMLEEVDYLHEVVQKIPLERIVLETDAPYFINNQMMLKAKEFTHPGCVMYTALKVAKLRNIPIEDVVKANYDNCDKLYNLPRNGMDPSSPFIQPPRLLSNSALNSGPMLLCGEDPFKYPVEDNEPDSTGEDMKVVRAVHATNDDDDDDYPEIPPMDNRVLLLDDEEDPEVLEHLEFELITNGH